MQAKLVVVDGKAKARQFDVVLPAIIGRNRSTDLTLGHPRVSRQHCEVFESDGLLMLCDLSSLNGTFVGGRRLAEQARPIEPGEQFTVGAVTFPAEYRATGSRSQAAGAETNCQTVDSPLDGCDEEVESRPSPANFPPKRDNNHPPRPRE